MDINLTKHSIKSEEHLFSDTLEIGIEETLHLNGAKQPKKILKCSGKTVVTSKYISDKTVTVEGTVCVSIIYLDTNNCLSNYEHNSFFSKTAEANNDLTDGEAAVRIIDEKFFAKIGGDCIVNISAHSSLEVTVIREKEKEMVCDIDQKCIEQLHSKIDSIAPISFGEKNLVLEEEISVGNSQPAVDCVIRSNATAVIDETKIMGGKVMVKGTVKVYVLYHSVEGTRPQCFEESFPFSQLIDVQGITEDCRVDSFVKILFCELAPHSMGDEEIRSFTVSLKLGVSVKAYCEEEIPAVIDAYSTLGGYSFKRETVSFKKLKESFCERFIARKNLEFTDGAIGSVIDMWCEVKGSTHKFEGQTLKITGTVLVNLLAYDCDGTPECYERPIDFEYTYTSKEQLCSPNAMYDITIGNCSYTITAANTVAVAVEPQVSVSIYDNMKKEILVDVVQDESAAPINRRQSSIVLYFAETGEKLWNIARRYNSSVEEIKTINSFTDDVLLSPKKFIIPTK
ncbi:MAG: DUF3794 domain-containing protein [Clostridia bacterium]|nr:DUF3794 domain-containing protein [Clostridia bacterium]